MTNIIYILYPFPFFVQHLVTSSRPGMIWPRYIVCQHFWLHKFPLDSICFLDSCQGWGCRYYSIEILNPILLQNNPFYYTVIPLQTLNDSGRIINLTKINGSNDNSRAQNTFYLHLFACQTELSISLDNVPIKAIYHYSLQTDLESFHQVPTASITNVWQVLLIIKYRTLQIYFLCKT